MSKADYFAGKYPVGSSMYKIHKHKFGPIPAAPAVVAVKKQVIEEPKEEEKPKAVKKTKKRTYKRKLED
jgi:hypothetical protein